MRQQALFLCAAVTLCFSATAQHAHFTPTLSFAKSYDITNLNKPVIHHASDKHANDKSVMQRGYPTLSPRLNIRDLHHQLGSDMQHLKLEQNTQQWQGIFQGLMQGVRSNNQPPNRL